jgi:hypothetical protein
MNGRIYDPLLGRFLSADVMVQNPGSLQSYNRYSYVRNNPLTLTDSSGFQVDAEPAGTIAGDAPMDPLVRAENKADAETDKIERAKIYDNEVVPAARREGVPLPGDADFKLGSSPDEALAAKHDETPLNAASVKPGSGDGQISVGTPPNADTENENQSGAPKSPQQGTADGTAPAAPAAGSTPASSAARSVSTPHGVAFQANTPEAQAALESARSGATVFRTGTLGTQETTEAQFWSFQNPSGTANYQARMGMPASETGDPDIFVMGGSVRSDSDVITRPAPGIGANGGGDMEAVVPPGGVDHIWFTMPDDPALDQPATE